MIYSFPFSYHNTSWKLADWNIKRNTNAIFIKFVVRPSKSSQKFPFSPFFYQTRFVHGHKFLSIWTVNRFIASDYTRIEWLSRAGGIFADFTMFAKLKDGYENGSLFDDIVATTTAATTIKTVNNGDLLAVKEDGNLQFRIKYSW